MSTPGTGLSRWLEGLGLANELPRGGLWAVFEEVAEFTDEGLLRVYDPLTYDICFSALLLLGLDRNEAFEVMMAHCDFSALVFQERIHDSPFDCEDYNDSEE